MDNPALKEIIEFAIHKLNCDYGFIGVAEGDEVVILNSDDGHGKDIKITIEIKGN